MHDCTRDDVIDLNALRYRLRRMTDAKLLEWGRAARYMCSPYATRGRPPRRSYVVQLEAAIAEWQRRTWGKHPA